MANEAQWHAPDLRPPPSWSPSQGNAWVRRITGEGGKKNRAQLAEQGHIGWQDSTEERRRSGVIIRTEQGHSRHGRQAKVKVVA